MPNSQNNSSDNLTHPPNPGDYGLDGGDIESLTKRRELIANLSKKQSGDEGFFYLVLFLLTLFLCYWTQPFKHGEYFWVICVPFPIAIVISFVYTIISMVFRRVRLYFVKRTSSILQEKLEKFENYEKVNNEFYRKLEEQKRIEEQERLHAERMVINYWRELGGIAFEQEIANLFRNAGYDVAGTPISGDKGIDLIIKRNSLTIIIQCKAHKKPVGPAVIRDLYGTLTASKADSAMLITIAGATRGVHDYVKDKPIKIWDINDIISFSKKYG